MKVLITGVSGTGKTAVCRELEKRGIKTIGIDETPGLRDCSTCYEANQPWKKGKFLRLIEKNILLFLTTYLCIFIKIIIILNITS